MQDREQVLSMLQEVRPDVDFDTETSLIDSGILDSFDIVTIVGELSEMFDVEISVDDLIPENFNSAQAMLELVTRLQEEA
ncbi:MAG TPA: acyl carrier protein [Clostridiales bacterium]|nr:acyl carrier protein [Clostridiales bacterium]